MQTATSSSYFQDLYLRLFPHKRHTSQLSISSASTTINSISYLWSLSSFIWAGINPYDSTRIFSSFPSVLLPFLSTLSSPLILCHAKCRGERTIRFSFSINSVFVFPDMLFTHTIYSLRVLTFFFTLLPQSHSPCNSGMPPDMYR
jgi:hypothetical protein